MLLLLRYDAINRTEQNKKLGGLGKRRRVVFYLLYNISDISGAVPRLSTEVKELCETDEFLKSYLMNIFGFPGKSKSNSNWCSSNCG